MTPPRTRQVLTVCLLVLGIVDVLLGWRAAWVTGDFFDFGVFYDSAGAWWSGANPYRLPNLNPPHIVALLSPLAWFTKPVAWILWQILNAAACLFVARLLSLRNATPHMLAWAVFSAHASTAAQTLMGQVVWLLAVPLALAWHAGLSARTDLAGVWLGITIAAKPFLIPMLAPALVDRTWRRLAAVALGTIAILGVATLGMFGPHLAKQWLDGRFSAWESIPQYLNAAPASLALALGLSPLFGICAGVGAVAATLFRWHSLSRERQWLASLLSALLVTPLCWIQYTAWLLPLTWLAWRDLRQALARAAIALTTVPPLFIVWLDQWHAIYVLGLICWLGAVLLPPAPAEPTKRDTSRPRMAGDAAR